MRSVQNEKSTATAYTLGVYLQMVFMHEMRVSQLVKDIQPNGIWDRCERHVHG